MTSGGIGGPERVAATMGLLSGPNVGLLDFAAIVTENSCFVRCYEDNVVPINLLSPSILSPLSIRCKDVEPVEEIA